MDALLIQGSIARKEMLDSAIQHRLPVLTSIRLGPSLGALMSYGSDYFALARWLRGVLVRQLWRAPPTERLPYVIRRLSDGQVVGVSTYFTAKAKHGGVEIGATFLRSDVRASFVNPEAKKLMLRHAFNAGAVRVQFTVDVRNERSQGAVAKLGAVREGILRRDTRTWTGHMRDTVVFSILDSEWPTVKLQLEQRLAKLAEPYAQE